MIRIKKPKVLCDKDNSTMKRESSSHKNQTRPTEKERKLLPRGKQARELREAPMTKKSKGEDRRGVLPFPPWESNIE